MSKLLYKGSQGMVQIRTNILNHATYSVSDGAYHGFFVFTRKNCGADFLERLYDGRITWNILDFEEFYEPQGAFYLADGSQTRTILQFLRHTHAEKDLGNAKKDQMMIIMTGLDQVDFQTNDMTKCLESVLGGSANLAGIDENLNRSKCAAESREWW